MLSLGASKPWPDAMEILTGTRKMDAGPILEYFKPLEKWLLQRNKELGIHIGWNQTYRKNLFRFEWNINSNYNNSYILECPDNPS